MRILFRSIVLVAAFASTASAQTLIHVPPVSAQAPSDGSHRGAYLGAAIGGSVGAGVGIWLANGLCDGAHCDMSGYFKTAFLFGAIGAGIGGAIGAASDHVNQRKQLKFMPAAVRVAPVLGPRVRAGVVSIGF